MFDLPKQQRPQNEQSSSVIYLSEAIIASIITQVSRGGTAPSVEWLSLYWKVMGPILRDDRSMRTMSCSWTKIVKPQLLLMSQHQVNGKVSKYLAREDPFPLFILPPLQNLRWRATVTHTSTYTGPFADIVLLDFSFLVFIILRCFKCFEKIKLKTFQTLKHTYLNQNVIK